MTRPRDLPIIDLMVELPRGGGGMGLDEARRLMKDADSADYQHHPAEYLFTDAGERMGEELTIDYGWEAEVAIPCACNSSRCRGWVVADQHVNKLRMHGTGLQAHHE